MLGQRPFVHTDGALIQTRRGQLRARATIIIPRKGFVSHACLANACRADPAPGGVRRLYGPDSYVKGGDNPTTPWQSSFVEVCTCLFLSPPFFLSFFSFFFCSYRENERSHCQESAQSTNTNHIELSWGKVHPRQLVQLLPVSSLLTIYSPGAESHA